MTTQIDFELLRETVESISDTVQILYESGISEAALVTLIQEACPTCTTRGKH